MDSLITFRENMEVSRKYKEEYVLGINKLIESRERDASTHRTEFCKNIFLNQEKYRDDLKSMLGWPLTGARPDGIPETRMEKLTDDVNCSIYRVSFEVLDDLYMTGLLFQKHNIHKLFFLIK